MVQHFDAYGEETPYRPCGDEAPKSAPAILGRAGQSIFWLLVLVVLLTRIAYFSIGEPIGFNTVDHPRQMTAR